MFAESGLYRVWWQDITRPDTMHESFDLLHFIYSPTLDSTPHTLSVALASRDSHHCFDSTNHFEMTSFIVAYNVGTVHLFG